MKIADTESVPDEVPRAEFEVVKTGVRPGFARLSLRRPREQVFPLRPHQYVMVGTYLFQILRVGEGSVDVWDESASLWGVNVTKMVRVRQWPIGDGAARIEW